MASYQNLKHPEFYSYCSHQAPQVWPNMSSLFGHSRSTGSSSLVSFLIACIKILTRDLGYLQKMFKCTLKIDVCDIDTFSWSPERGLIYFFFLIRLSIADAHQNVTLADLVLAFKFPKGSSSFLRHSYRLLTGQSTSPLPSHPDPFSSMYASKAAL